MMQYFVEAWNDVGLTPLEKLIWLRVCDSGSQQIVVMQIEDWMSWTGAESINEILNAMHSLLSSGRVVDFGLRAPGGIYIKSQFAKDEFEFFDEESECERKTNKYRKTSVSYALRKQIMERDMYRCVYCGTHKNLTLDHIYPEFKGGKTQADNLCVACKSCNSSKGIKTIEEWKGCAK